MVYRIMTSESFLEHHGILGQKWGVRRFQNHDGSLTAEGRARYLSGADFDGDTVSVKIKRAASNTVAKIKEKADARKAERAARKQAEKEKAAEEERKARERIVTAKKYEELAKINPKYLTDQELKMMNDRKRAEDDFIKNYRLAEKKGKEYAIDVADALVRQVLIPAAVGLGKAHVDKNLKRLQRKGKLPVEYADLVDAATKGKVNNINKNKKKKK